MSFLGIGLPEIVLILVIAIIVVGPQRLPEVAVQLARAIRHLRGYATDATAQIRAELDELTKEYEQVRQELQEFRQTIGKSVSAVTSEVDRALQESRPMIEPSAEPPPEKRTPKGPAGEH
ncbi:MAG: twin-arginine translocase subunit TatB [Chloroflexi bacterium]|nr:twin-arginine translocase subunit TatB [Chloroflexota bacterium]